MYFRWRGCCRYGLGDEYEILHSVNEGRQANRLRLFSAPSPVEFYGSLCHLDMVPGQKHSPWRRGDVRAISI